MILFQLKKIKIFLIFGLSCVFDRVKRHSIKLKSKVYIQSKIWESSTTILIRIWCRIFFFLKMGSYLTPVWHDRDSFIRVNEENILPKMKNNFKKRSFGDAEVHTSGSVNPQHTPYDLLSVTSLWKEDNLDLYGVPCKIFRSFDHVCWTIVEGRESS